MKNSRWFLLILSYFISWVYCSEPQYYDDNPFVECFEGNPGWYPLAGTCIFPLTQFERNHSTAVQMCGAINHSIGYRETNWLIASLLLDLFTKQKNQRDLNKLYWTGLVINSYFEIGVEQGDDSGETDTPNSGFTSIYNPLWADGQPPDSLPTKDLIASCIALDLRNSTGFGWRALPCSYQLPILCQNYACIPGTFRCADNSKCIPASFQNDGFKDCLDGSDESGSQTFPRMSSSSSSSLFLSTVMRENPVYEWPMITSNGGILSPTTMRYGIGECTHKWIVLSPNDQHFVIWIKWLSSSSSTKIYVEGKNQDGRILINSRNSTSSVTLASSSFILTASDTDIRRVEFQVYFQEADDSLCKITEDNKLIFNSEQIATPCHYKFATRNLNSYTALLINKCEGTNPVVSIIQFDNSTVTLTPRSSKKLLILPTNSLEIFVNSSWPHDDTKMDIQFLELTPESENVDVFLIDSHLEIHWIAKSTETIIEGKFRKLTVSMIITKPPAESEVGNPEMWKSTWKVNRITKSCCEDQVQILSMNQSTFVSESGVFAGVGPTTVVIYQSTEPFEFHAFFNVQPIEIISTTPGRLLYDYNSDVDSTSATTIVPIVTTSVCKLPIVVNGYIASVSDLLYSIGTVVTVNCTQGYSSGIVPFSITCLGNGSWYGNQNTLYEADHPTVQCSAINCPNHTLLEINNDLPPDNTNTSYSTVRKYPQASYPLFEPICICGDDIQNPDQWVCYNMGNATIGACILPEVNDAIIVNPSNGYLFQNGSIIYMNCTFCPTMIKEYVCVYGVWWTEGKAQPYDMFRCDCSIDPHFVDPCKPYGVYVQHSGFFSCECLEGYKFSVANQTCVDRDECYEGSDYCDSFAKCQNTIGGFYCICPENYHIYNSSLTDYQWNNISGFLINGYSCVESLCHYENEWQNYNYTVLTSPNARPYYKNDTSTDYLYATNLCEADGFPCVFQFEQKCENTKMTTIHDPLKFCPALNFSLFNFANSGSSAFQMVDLSCKMSYMIMIGRPKIFCNSTSDWEIMPTCIYPSCSDPMQFINLPLIIDSIDRPLGTKFEYLTQIYFKCEAGYILDQRDTSITCIIKGGGLEWSDSIPTCTRSTTAITSASSFSSYFTLPINSSTNAPVWTDSSTTAPVWTGNSTTAPTGTDSSTTAPVWTGNSTTAPVWTGNSTTAPVGTDSSTTASVSTDSSTTAPVRTDSSTTASVWTGNSTTAATSLTSSPYFYDDIVIEGTMTFDDKNILQQREIWTKTADWLWTSSGCIVHQWTFPFTFLVTSTPIQLESDQVEIIIDISQFNSSVQLGVVSTIDGFIPPISEFRTVMNTTSSGSFSVKLRNLKPFLALSISASGYVQICEVTIRENKCKDVDYNGLHLASSGPFKMRRYISVTCHQNRAITRINGYCDSRRGWVIQRTPCLCDTTPPCRTVPHIPQLDSQTECSLNSCQNGVCQQYAGYYDCVCNDFFTRSLNENGEPCCVPDHCSFTSKTRNSNYNCSTGQEDKSVNCTGYALYGDFCQYEGVLLNDSYTYLLGTQSENAIATNVCSSVDLEYALPFANCSQPLSSTATNGCDSLCYRAAQCIETDDLFYGAVYCYCEFGWYGRSCTANKRCFDTENKYLCLNGGTCLLTQTNVTCSCLPNFTGQRCETALEEDTCFSGEIDCVHGICTQENDVKYCNCNDGYIRDSDGNCTVVWDMCQLNNPCQQNGRCMFNTTTGGQTCDCGNSGWKGTYCESQSKLDDCSYCKNSTARCFDTFTSHVRCQCSPGFSGDYCEETVDNCRFDPCFNHGTCNIFYYTNSNNDLIESYNCTCPTGFSGTNCEIRHFQDCTDLIQCENGGTCEIDSNGNAICLCTDQFYGRTCNQSCYDKCAHSYGCTQYPNGTLTCFCNDGFDYQYCDHVENVCTANVLVCQNSGTCNALTKSCDCPEYFNGTYCEKNNNLCETDSVICENGGTCAPLSGTCKCLPNFTGQFCENQIHSCRDITCFNGGTCIAYNATCECLPGSTGDRCETLGQPCLIYQPNGTITPYCLNGGTCQNLPNGAACTCKDNYTGRRCETLSTFYFNLVFNGLGYSPDIVSKTVSNASIAQFTLCSFVQYNQPIVDSNSNDILDTTLLPPWLSMQGTQSQTQLIIFDNNGFFICDKLDKTCNRRFLSNFKPTPITANTWHHFCIVSPGDLIYPNYTVYLDGLVVSEQLAENFNPGANVHLLLAPSTLTDNRFVGMISMTQLYYTRLNETQIGQLAFNCYDAMVNDKYDLARDRLINWNGDFTHVSFANPGVYVDPSGICSSVKCLFGRQTKSNNYNSTGTCDKDRIPPTVLRCPATIRQGTTEDFTRVQWSDQDVSFFDNIGVVKIEVNYHNGQQFGIGITAVRYIAFDAAGNSAECTFDVIVTQKMCPSNVVVEGGTVQHNSTGPFAADVSIVNCFDSLYPTNNRPRFYVCDIMGSYKYGGWIDNSRSKYYLPACGKTQTSLQEINGTVVGNGTCSQVFQRLHDIIWSSANCDQSSSCNLMILPPCDESTWISSAGINNNVALQYIFSTRNATETISSTILEQLQSNFSYVRQDSSVSCDPSYPIHNTNGNVTVCVSCAEGTYADISSNQCLDCPVNTFRSSENFNQLSCTPCPNNTITGKMIAAFDISQCYRNCLAGQYESKGNCLACPEGTFGPTEGIRKCVSCDFDSSTFGDGKTSSRDCSKTCIPGQEMVRNESQPVPYCQDCAVGFYKTNTSGPCIQCPRGLTTKLSASKSIDDCNVVYCIDENTKRNTNPKVSPNTPYSELCITCEPGTFQNESNADYCIPCTDLSDDTTDIPVTCQSTCSADVPTAGCDCQVQKKGNSSLITRNCVPIIKPNHANSPAIKIVMIVVFGVLLIILIVVIVCFRKPIIAWFRKTPTDDNQRAVINTHLPFFNQTSLDVTDADSGESVSSTPPSTGVRRTPPYLPPSIPRPNLTIVTSQAEMDQLPPLSSSSPPYFNVNNGVTNEVLESGIGTSHDLQSAGTYSFLVPAMLTSNTVSYEANGSPIFDRKSATSSKKEISSDDSSLDDFY